MFYVRRPRRFVAVVVVLSAFALTGCGGESVGDALGLGRRSPDEFQVVQRPPLVLPPDFRLRPPEPGAPPALEATTREQAQVALTGEAIPSAPPTPGQQALVAAAGPVEPDIRNIVAEETVGQAGLDTGRFWFILDFQRRRLERAERDPLDARAEAERLAAAGINVRSVRLSSQPLPPTGGG